MITNLNNRLRVALVAVVALAGATLTARADAPAGLPAGKEVLEKAIEKSGGRAAYEAVKNRVSTIKMSIPAAGVNGTMTMRQTADGNALMEAELPQVGTIKTGLSDGVLWEMNPMTGVRIIDGTEKQQQVRAFTLNSELNPEKFYKSIETTGKEKVGDREAFVVKLTSEAGDVETRYYDAENFRLLKVEGTVKSPMGEIQTVSEMSDWKTFDKIEMPTKITQTVQGMQIITTMEKVEHNVTIDPAVFELPEDVKKMKEGGAAPAAPGARGKLGGGVR